MDAAVASEAGPTGRAARWHRRLGGLREPSWSCACSELKSDEPESGRVAAVTRDPRGARRPEPLRVAAGRRAGGAAGAGALGRMARSSLGAGAAGAAATRCASSQLLADLRPMASVGPVTLAEVRRVLLPRLAQLDRDPPKSRFGQRLRRRRPTRCAGARSASCSSSASPSASSRSAAARIRCCSTRCAARSARRSPSRTIASPASACGCASPSAPPPSAAGCPTRGSTSARGGRGCRRSTRWTSCAPRPARCRITSASSTTPPSRPAPGWRGRRLTIPASAIDVWEHDLAVLGRLLRPSSELPAKGAAHYLLELNPALARSLRTRWARWKKTWSAVGRPGRQPRRGAGAAGRATPHRAAVLRLGAAALRRVPVPVPARRDLPLPAARAARGDRPARSADARRHLPRNPARRAAGAAEPRAAADSAATAATRRRTSCATSPRRCSIATTIAWRRRSSASGRTRSR